MKQATHIGQSFGDRPYAGSCEDGYLYYICTVSQLCSMFAQLLFLKVKGL